MFIPVALGLLLTFLVNPVVSVLQGRGLGRTPAVILVVILMFSLLGGIGWTITADLSSLAAELPRYEENICHKIADLRGVGHSSFIETIQAAAQKVMDELQQTNKPAGETEKPVQVVVQDPSVLWQLPLALEPLATAGLVLILVIFMLLKQADLRDRLLALYPLYWLHSGHDSADGAGSWPWRSGPGCGDRWASCSPLRSPSASGCSANMSQLGFIGVLISDGPVLETSTSYYQRLVARDDDEAMEIVDESLTEDDWHFIVQATREIVEDLGTRQSPAETPAAVAAAAVVDGQAHLAADHPDGGLSDP